MANLSALSPLWTTGLSLVIGGIGAAAATWLSLPAPILIGPAVAVCVAALAGLRMDIDSRARDLCFVVLGVSLGAGFNAEAGAALLHWPLAFVALVAGLLVTMLASRQILERGFGLDRRSAVLASAPGHLSFVMSLAADTRSDVARIAVIQSIRLLALTLIVPFVALAMGFPMADIGIIAGPVMSVPELVVLCALGVVLGLVFARFRVPAALLLGGMAVSGLGHVTGLATGSLPKVVITPAYVVLGTLIGTRFSGISLAQLRDSFLAGTLITVMAAAVAVLTAVPVALALGMPAAHVLTAFAPGGLETMIALGTTLHADPGFVVACHIMRLMALLVLIPLLLGRNRAEA